MELELPVEIGLVGGVVAMGVTPIHLEEKTEVKKGSKEVEQLAIVALLTSYQKNRRKRSRESKKRVVVTRDRSKHS